MEVVLNGGGGEVKTARKFIAMCPAEVLDALLQGLIRLLALRESILGLTAPIGAIVPHTAVFILSLIHI